MPSMRRSLSFTLYLIRFLLVLTFPMENEYGSSSIPNSQIRDQPLHTMRRFGANFHIGESSSSSHATGQVHEHQLGASTSTDLRCVELTYSELESEINHELSNNQAYSSHNNEPVAESLCIQCECMPITTPPTNQTMTMNNDIPTSCKLPEATAGWVEQPGDVKVCIWAPYPPKYCKDCNTEINGSNMFERIDTKEGSKFICVVCAEPSGRVPRSANQETVPRNANPVPVSNRVIAGPEMLGTKGMIYLCVVCTGCCLLVPSGAILAMPGSPLIAKVFAGVYYGCAVTGALTFLSIKACHTDDTTV